MWPKLLRSIIKTRTRTGFFTDATIPGRGCPPSHPSTQPQLARRASAATTASTASTASRDSAAPASSVYIEKKKFRSTTKAHHLEVIQDPLYGVCRQTLKETLDIPLELADALLMGCRPLDPWLRCLREDPHDFRQRVDRLVGCDGLSRPEIVENLSLLIESDAYLLGYVPVPVFEKREKLHPFTSYAELCAHLFDIPLETFYLAAANELSLLSWSKPMPVKIHQLIQFGYPKDLILRNWRRIANISVEKIKPRIDQIKRLEKEYDCPFTRHHIFAHRQLFADEGTFQCFLLRFTGSGRLNQLPPNVAIRVKCFAERVGVPAESVIQICRERISEGAWLFYDEEKMGKIIAIFAAVGVRGDVLLENTRFFDQKPEDVEDAVNTVRQLYGVDALSPYHLHYIWGLLTKGVLVEKVPTIARTARRKSDDVLSGYTEDKRMLLFRAGFSLSSITSASHTILELTGDQICLALERERERFSKKVLASASLEDQVKLINLLQYFAEQNVVENDAEDD